MGAAAAFFETFETDVDPFRFSYGVFFFALPLLNAILDTASWAVSQGLGREMLNREFRRGGMVGLALSDVVCAFAFLCGLAVLLGAELGEDFFRRIGLAVRGADDLDQPIEHIKGKSKPFEDMDALVKLLQLVL